ncbi:MAG: hypothetical protein H6Q60_428 [Oscillospiraceae bacterium]|nr:hypothetical protein [Oscillospiraceae bacterium]
MQHATYQKLCQAVLDVLPELALKVNAEGDAQAKLEQLLSTSLAETRCDTNDAPFPTPEQQAELNQNDDLEASEREESQMPTPEEQKTVPWAELLREMQSLREDFNTRLNRDAHQDTLFDNMHRELTAFRNRALEKSTDQMSLDIISVMDNLDVVLRSLPETLEHAAQMKTESRWF